MTVSEVCNREVVIIQKHATILEAAQRMREFHVGDLIVIEERAGKRIPVGIVTDRDIVLEVIAEDIDMRDVDVGDIMSDDLVTVEEKDDLMDTIKLMRAKGVRRVPVVDGANALVGILAVDDLIELFAEQIGDLSKIIVREQVREKARRT
ncbi:MAG: CBS domain-containing protein [Pseudomonadota bacterium]